MGLEHAGDCRYCRAPFSDPRSDKGAVGGQDVKLFCSRKCSQLFHTAKRTYGLTSEQLAELRDVQDCAACNHQPATHNIRRSMSVDHDHATGQVRALIHHTCNAGIGHAHEDPEKLHQWAIYLTKHHHDIRDLLNT
jgi:hypothetical protein